MDIKIKIDTYEKIQSFVNKATKCEEDIFAKGGLYTVNAKSFLGILSLDLSKPITIHSDSMTKENALKKFGDFVV